MSSLTVENGLQTFYDNQGNPLNYGFVYVGQVNVDPVTNPSNVYWDFAKTIPAQQPIRTISGRPVRNGSPSNFYVDGDYSITIKDSKNSFLYYSPNSNSMWANLASSDPTKGAAMVGFKQSGIGAVAMTIDAKLKGFVTPEDFGGSSVINSIIFAMNAASAAGVPLRCSPVDYQTDTAVTPPASMEWHANGCRIVANTDISTSAVRILNNDIRIRGLLRISLSDIGGSPTAYRGHVLVGDWQDGSIAPTNFRFDDLYFEGGHSNVNGLAVAGGASVIRGKSVRCGDSSKIGRLFMPHWGNFNQHFLSGGIYQHSVDAGPTTHPHDIIIDEVSSGVLSCGTGDFMAVVAISAGYDIQIGKVSGTVNNSGAGGSDVVLLTAGDLGFAYATPAERAKGMRGINISSVIGQSTRNGINRIGQALYYNADSTPQPTAYYFALIEDTISYIDIKVTGTVTSVIAGTNGYGKTKYGVVNAEGGRVCAGFANYNRSTAIDVLRCKNSVTKALEIAGSGADTTLHPDGIEIRRLEIDTTDAGGSGTQVNSLGMLIQSARRVQIGVVYIIALANTGYAGLVSTLVNSIRIGETFLPDNYNATLTFAYSNSGGYADAVSFGNVFGPTTVNQAITGGTTFRTVGRNREFYSNANFLSGLSVTNGDRTWITAASGPALTQVKTSGLIGSTAVTKDQLTYT